SNLALQAVTGIVSIASCIVQTQAFFLSTQLHGQSTGRASDPDFYSAMQTFLMQTLALYTALAPTLRSTGPRYGFWTCLLSALSLASSIASLAVYPSFPTLSPLVACVANALQAFVTLQLVFALDDGRHGSQTVGRKKDV
ncbi:hypothetical protein MMC19_000920, partial [Ptychographa xylographoides]|nr:hypothetical protein [Ptychographa xylographoides]